VKKKVLIETKAKDNGRKQQSTIKNKTPQNTHVAARHDLSSSFYSGFQALPSIAFPSFPLPCHFPCFASHQTFSI
jgi:hypothetical protein